MPPLYQLGGCIYNSSYKHIGEGYCWNYGPDPWGFIRTILALEFVTNSLLTLLTSSFGVDLEGKFLYELI
jgi:hypothetical protein